MSWQHTIITCIAIICFALIAITVIKECKKYRFKMKELEKWQETMKQINTNNSANGKSEKES